MAKNAPSLSEGFNQIKAHGNRTLLMKGKKSGDLVGHVDVVPRVNVSDMSSNGDGHHAYAVSKRKGKHGISHYVTRRLGEFNTHDEAVAAVKKFHKIEESTFTMTKKTDQQIIAEAIDALSDPVEVVLEAKGEVTKVVKGGTTLGHIRDNGGNFTLFVNGTGEKDRYMGVHKTHDDALKELGRFHNMKGKIVGKLSPVN